MNKILSDEVIVLISKYIELLGDWNSRMNLVSRKTNFHLEDNFYEKLDEFLYNQKLKLECTKQDSVSLAHEKSQDSNIQDSNAKEINSNSDFMLLDTSTIAYHIANSIQIINLIDQNSIVGDVGSGNGMPGVFLSFFNFTKVFLIESNLKKATFLNEVVHKLGLSNTEVLHKPIQECGNYQFDFLISRAFSGSSTLESAIDRVKYSKLLVFKSYNFDHSTLNTSRVLLGYGSKILELPRPPMIQTKKHRGGKFKKR